MDSDKAPLIDPNGQYPPMSTAPGPNYPPAHPPQYATPYNYHPPSQAPSTAPWSQTPVTSQPHVQYHPSHLPVQIPKPWSTGLCDCCEKPGACLLGYFCPCIFAGRLAKRLGGSFWYGCCCNRHLEVIARPYVRARHNITGDFCNDCLVAFFCGPCGTCQVDRELDRLGYP